MSGENKRELWSDSLSEEDMVNKDVEEIVYNLLEDIKCLKEDLKSKSVWTPIDNWEDLPEGTWLAQLEDDTCQVVRVTKGGLKHGIILVGNHFHWDAPKPISYKSIN